MNDIIVSVVVITYNSADYVLETLESIKKQTYKNIELIITDDKSKDNTIEICNKWLDENSKEFIKSRIIITANGNRDHQSVLMNVVHFHNVVGRREDDLFFFRKNYRL